jgi:hypothetical protein
MFWRTHRLLLVDAHHFAEHAVGRSAEPAAGHARADRPVDPIGKVERAGKIAEAEARDLAANGHDFAGAVGKRHQRRTYLNVIMAARNREIAKIKRGGAHPENDVVRARHGVGPLHRTKVIEPDPLGIDI